MTVLSADQFPGAEREPLSYPGERPGFSYIYCQNKIYKILCLGDTYGDLWIDDLTGRISLDDFLTRHGNAPTDQRHAVLAVGSNGCPGRLAEKYGYESDVALPVFAGTLADATVVYSRRLTGYGALPATYLYQPGTVSWLSVTMLTDEQMAHMDGTEGVGRSYERISIPGYFRAHGGPRIGDLTAYLDRNVLAYEGKPVLLKMFTRKGPDWPIMDERDLLSLVFDQAGLLPNKTIESRHEKLLADKALRLQFTEFLEKYMSGLKVDKRGRLATAGI
jgi:hypothetical protein